MLAFKNIVKKSIQFALVTGMSVAVVIPALGKEHKILNQASADADVIVVVPNLGDLDQKIKKFIAKVGIPAPPMSPLQLIEMQSGKQGLRDHLDLTGSAMIVFSDLAQAIKHQDEPSVTLYLPTKKADDLKTLLFKDDFRPPATRSLDNYLVIGKDEMALDAAKPANKAKQILAKLGKPGQSLLDANEISFIVLNTDKTILPTIKNELLNEISNFENMPEDKQKRAQQRMLGVSPLKVMQFFSQALDRLLGDNQSVIAGLDFAKQGLAIQSNSRYKKDSPAGKFLQSGSNSTPQLGTIPNTNDYLLVSAADYSKMDLSKIMNPIHEIVKPAIDHLDEEGAQLVHDLFDAKNWPVKGSFGMKGSPMDESFASLTTYTYDTHQGAVDSYNWLGKVVDKLKGLEIQGHKIFKEFSVEEKAMTVDGIDFAKTTINMNVPQGQRMGMAEMALLGSTTNQTHYTAVIGKSLVSLQMKQAPTAEALQAVVNAVKNQKGIGANPALASIKGNLHKSPTAEFYLNPKAIVDIANPFLGMMQVQIELPDDIEPIGASYKITNANISERIFVSYDTVQQLVASGLAAQKQMQDQQRKRRGIGPQ